MGFKGFHLFDCGVFDENKHLGDSCEIQDSDSFCADGDACQKPVEIIERKDELKLILFANCGGSDQEEVDPGDLEPEVNVEPVSGFVGQIGSCHGGTGTGS